MTLATALIILFVPIAAWVSVWLRLKRAKWEMARLNTYDKWTTQFYSEAEYFLNRDDLPRSWVELLGDVNNMITEPLAARAITELKFKSGDPLEPEEEAFIDGHSDVTAKFARMIMAGLLAMSYTNAFWGVLARAKLAERFGRFGHLPLTPRDMNQIAIAAHHSPQTA